MTNSPYRPALVRPVVACLIGALSFGGGAVALAGSQHATARAPLTVSALKVTPASAAVGQKVTVRFRATRAGKASVLIRSARNGKAFGAYTVGAVKGRNRVALIGSGALRARLKVGRYIVSVNGGAQPVYGDVPTVFLTIRRR